MAARRKVADSGGSKTEDKAYTTVTTRLTQEQLTVVRDAAKRRGCSLAKFLQHAAIERASEIINCEENRSGVQDTARLVLSLFSPQDLEITYKGITFDTNERGWAQNRSDSSGLRELMPQAPSLPSGPDCHPNPPVAWMLAHDKYTVVSYEPPGPSGPLDDHDDRKRTCLYETEDLGKIAWNSMGEWYNEALLDPYVLYGEEPGPRPLLEIKQGPPLLSVDKIAKAITHGGREFAALLDRVRQGPSRFVSPDELLGPTKAKDKSSRKKRS